MNRRQLFKKIAGIAGAVVAAPVMAKEIACLNGDPLDADLGPFPFYLDSPVKPCRFVIERKKFVEFPSNPVEGDMLYGADGYFWIFSDSKWKCIAQYDILDGQHSSYHAARGRVDDFASVTVRAENPFDTSTH